MSFFSENIKLNLSGERFSVIYRVYGSESEAYARSKDICLEQTVEFPEELVPNGDIKDFIVGKIENFERWDSDSFKAIISYPIEVASDELTQLINVIFGNISMKSGIKVEKINFSKGILKNFKGPRFGREGLRKILRIPKRPILFTAIKPMGLSSKELAELAYKFAIGGIDIIKDDHGLSNQVFSPFEERVKLCSEAVERANKETGYNCIYVPNVTGPYNKVIERSKKAKELGAKGLLVSPGLVGLDTMREIAEDDSIDLPIFSHPAFQGSYAINQNGISHATIFGQLARLAGSDTTIYPNFGGRFSFSIEECRSIVEASIEPMEHIKEIFPSPAGGMSLESIPTSLEIYGNDVVFLVGGGIFKYGQDIVQSCKHFMDLVNRK